MGTSFKTQEFEFQYSEKDISNPAHFESHCHEKFEMIAVLEGDVQLMLEGITYTIKKNQAVIIPPFLYHVIFGKRSADYSRVIASFTLSAIPHVLQGLFSADKNSTTPFYASKAEELKKICKAPFPEYYGPLAESYMTQIFYDYAEGLMSKKPYQTDAFLQSAIEYIDAHIKEKILIEDLAAHTFRSKSSFCHLFENKMKITPKQYILQKKLALAHKLIHEGVSATEAAMWIGYENYSNFYRAYKNQYGLSPTKKH